MLYVQRCDIMDEEDYSVEKTLPLEYDCMGASEYENGSLGRAINTLREDISEGSIQGITTWEYEGCTLYLIGAPENVEKVKGDYFKHPHEPFDIRGFKTRYPEQRYNYGLCDVGIEIERGCIFSTNLEFMNFVYQVLSNPINIVKKKRAEGFGKGERVMILYKNKAKEKWMYVESEVMGSVDNKFLTVRKSINSSARLRISNNFVVPI